MSKSLNLPQITLCRKFPRCNITFKHILEVEKFNGHELSDWFKANLGFLPDDKVEEFNSTLGDAVMYTADILDVADILE